MIRIMSLVAVMSIGSVMAIWQFWPRYTVTYRYCRAPNARPPGPDFGQPHALWNATRCSERGLRGYLSVMRCDAEDIRRAIAADANVAPFPNEYTYDSFICERARAPVAKSIGWQK